jgi:CYTH domain-containing protein
MPNRFIGGKVIEIERRFLVRTLPENLESMQGTLIQQGYFEVDGEAPLQRVRSREGKYHYTVKTGSGLIRGESEWEITREEFLEHWPKTAGMRLVKTRYHIPVSGLVAELDIFHEDLDGFQIVEVEFSSKEQSETFTPPEWFGPEVTTVNGFSNAQFARSGIPADYKELLSQIV